MGHLDNLLTSSDPGASMHHLHVVGAPVGPLGLPDEGQLHTTVYAIAADGVSDGLGGVDGFVAKTIAAAAVQEAQDGRVVLLAGLSQEAWAVTYMDELGRRLQLQGRLEEHPDVAEVTIVYAACRDGRRWTGRRWLTGPKAGLTEDVELVVGRPHPREGGPQGRLVRVLAGVGG